MDFIISMENPSDVPPDDLYIHSFMRMLPGSVKPNIYTAKDRKDMEDIFCFAVAVAGTQDALRDRPFPLLYAEPISPLLIPEISAENNLLCWEGNSKGLYSFAQQMPRPPITRPGRSRSATPNAW